METYLNEFADTDCKVEREEREREEYLPLKWYSFRLSAAVYEKFSPIMSYIFQDNAIDTNVVSDSVSSPH